MNGFNWEAGMAHPLTLMGAGMMAGSDPRRTGLGGIGAGILQAEQRLAERAKLVEENERARMLADLQARKLDQKLAKQAQPDLSKTPTYIRDPQGNLRILQLSATGQPFQTPLPEGYTPALPLTYQDVGPAIVGMQRGATTPSVIMEKGLTPEAMPETRAAQTAATARATATQAAIEELPLVEETANRTISYIDELMKHPGLEAGTGLSSMFPVIPGSERADFEARKAQLVGGAFLQAYQELKGGGQITEIEGQKAEQSLARMESALSKKDFREALQDFRSVVDAGRKRAKKRAGQQSPQPTGNVIDWSEL